jgi:2-dehydro-3-deoxygluconokinase
MSPPHGAVAGVDVMGIGEAMVLLMPDHADGTARLSDADRLRVDVAGAELNVCATVAALGGTAALCTRVGDDPLGAQVRRSLQRVGVRDALVVSDPDAPTGLLLREPAGTAVDDRRVHYYRRGSAASCMTGADAQRMHRLPHRAVVVSGLTAALGPGPAECVEVAVSERPPHVLGVLDANLRPQLGPVAPVVDRLVALLPRVDVLVLGTDEGRELFGTSDPGRIMAGAAAAGARECVVKGGAAGAWVPAGDGTVCHLPARADRVVDPVGAGDAFTGAYVLSRLRGAPPLDSAERASAVAALVVGAWGDLGAVPALRRLSWAGDMT